ncbi:putative Transcription factor MYB20 [Cocos nucifera]|uniref:Putative Transcription factor MYB20 n=1 Tax=Cocos nucifera TaxID=13894 RepID=A0A8K0N5Y8_COCNU|nr:putative Transcription factor MYB20 [Cocos nucifera]
MGIDPLTHKPIAETVDQQQQQGHASVNGNDKNDQLCKQCPPKVAEEEAEEKSITSSSDPAEADAFLSKSPGFCTDEVPMIEPHEIIVPCASSTLSISSASISSSCSSSSSDAKPEEIQLPCMEWPESLYLWGLDDFMGLDFLNDDEDGKLGLDPFNQYQRSALDQESWKFALF